MAGLYSQYTRSISDAYARSADYLPQSLMYSGAHRPMTTGTHRSAGVSFRPRTAGNYYHSMSTQRLKTDPVGRLSMSSQLKLEPLLDNSRQVILTRANPTDWRNTSINNALMASEIKTGSERIRKEAAQMVRGAEDQTRLKQADAGQKLGQRIGDINYWKYELEHESDKMVAEMQLLSDLGHRMSKSLREMQVPLHIAEECLRIREQRQNCDLVHDCVEKELIQEVNLANSCMDKMKNGLYRIDVQQRANRDMLQNLELDTTDKLSALSLDETSFQLSNTSQGINFHEGIENAILNTEPRTWALHSHSNIRAAQAERENSEQLRKELEAMWTRCFNEMQKQFNDVNYAFARRKKEYEDAKQRAEEQLARVLTEIFDSEKNIDLLRKSLKDLEAPLKVAETRIRVRADRPNVELCRDEAHQKLVSEIHGLRNTMLDLQDKLKQAENAHSILLETKENLQLDVDAKANSLFIDKERCMSLRNAFPMSLARILA